MEITKNKLVNCYELIEEEPSNYIDKLKDFLDNNKFLEIKKEFSKNDTINVYIYKTKPLFNKNKYMFEVYKYGYKSFTKSFANLEDLVNFSKNFTKGYHFNHHNLKFETTENYNKRLEVEKNELNKRIEIEKKESEYKRVLLKQIKEFENIL
jgi:hypothetical protein